MPAKLPDVPQPDLEQPAVKQADAEQPSTPLCTGQVASHPVDQAKIPGIYIALHTGKPNIPHPEAFLHSMSKGVYIYCSAAVAAIASAAASLYMLNSSLNLELMKMVCHQSFQMISCEPYLHACMPSSCCTSYSNWPASC